MRIVRHAATLALTASSVRVNAQQCQPPQHPYFEFQVETPASYALSTGSAWRMRGAAVLSDRVGERLSGLPLAFGLIAFVKCLKK